MVKNYIDVPTIGYKTWLVSVGYIDKNGNFIDNEDSDLISNISKQYPYSNENEHVR